MAGLISDTSTRRPSQQQQHLPTQGGSALYLSGGKGHKRCYANVSRSSPALVGVRWESGVPNGHKIPTRSDLGTVIKMLLSRPDEDESFGIVVDSSLDVKRYSWIVLPEERRAV